MNRVRRRTAVWDPEKQRRFDALRCRRDQSALPSDEQQELEHLFQEVELAEWASLRPTLDTYQEEQEQMRASLDRVEAENAVL